MNSRSWLLSHAASMFAVTSAIAAPLALTAPPRPLIPIRMHLISAEDAVQPGGRVFLAVQQQIDAGWHTYWVNPGDAGAAARITWSALPKGWSVSAPLWPAPGQQMSGSSMSYGYRNELVLPLTVRAPHSARPGTTVVLNARVDALACKDMCVPVSTQVSLRLRVADRPSPTTAAELVQRALDAVPKSGSVTASLQRKSDGFQLAIEGLRLNPGQANAAHFYPLDPETIIDAAPQQPRITNGRLVFTLKTVGTAAIPAAAAKLNGVVAVAGRSYQVSAQLPA
jgi:DsbC/DsbD-like thiol-disulfide interchange protein